ncbi:MAG TPA: glycosyltransferase [Polyangiaceae bacterium]|nr:glycosyltransferase [Polyangiaceae bacterium]
MPKQLSIVIPTYNRRERLGRVLRALSEQTVDLSSFEAVVVDDGSKDGTSEWLKEQSFGFEVQVLSQTNRGPAEARNAGIDAAQGELVLFLDDDVVPEPQLIEEHLKSHAAEADVVVMGPLVSLDHYEQPWVAWEQEKLERQYQAMTRKEWEPTYRQFWTGNASIARAHLLAAGKFDPTFKRGEDVELGLRLHERGLKFRFNGRARGLHHAERSLDSWEHAHRSYGRLEAEMLSSRPNDEVVSILSGNWRRLNPLTRAAARLCIQSPALNQGATRLLREALKTEPMRRSSFVSSKACSLLANILYWRESAAVLGPDRLKRVFRQARKSTS